MKRSYKALLAVLAALALSSVGAASASAVLPEFSPAGSPGNPIRFVTDSAPVTWEVENGIRLECRSMDGTGEIVGANEMRETMEMRGCETSNYFCDNGFLGSEGIVKSEQLVGRLGYVNTTEKTVALWLEGPGGGPLKRPVFAKFTCNKQTVELKGHLMGYISPLNAKTKILTIEYEQAGGTQIPNKADDSSEHEDLAMQLFWYSGGTFSRFGLGSTVFDSGFSQNESNIEIEARG